MGVAAKERERRLQPGQEVGRPQLRSPVGTPGPAGTGGHRTGSVPNARLYGPPVGGPEGRRPAGRVQGPAVVGQNLPEDPPTGVATVPLERVLTAVDTGYRR